MHYPAQTVKTQLKHVLEYQVPTTLSPILFSTAQARRQDTALSR